MSFFALSFRYKAVSSVAVSGYFPLNAPYRVLRSSDGIFVILKIFDLEVFKDIQNFPVYKKTKGGKIFYKNLFEFFSESKLIVVL